MKVLSLLSSAFTVAQVCAFAPSSPTNKHNSRLSIATTEEITAMTEKSVAVPFLLRPQKCKGYVGDVGFDPFYFSNDWSMEYLREAELKHGRVCMLAWCGWIAVDLGIRVYPIPEGWANLNALTAHDALVTVDPSNPQGFWASPLANLLYALAIPEIYQFSRVNEMLREGKTCRAAGDLGWDFLGFTRGRSEEEVNELKLAEIKHARLGMLAFSGVVTQNLVGATTFPYINDVSAWTANL